MSNNEPKNYIIIPIAAILFGLIFSIVATIVTKTNCFSAFGLCVCIGIILGIVVYFEGSEPPSPPTPIPPGTVNNLHIFMGYNIPVKYWAAIDKEDYKELSDNYDYSLEEGVDSECNKEFLKNTEDNRERRILNFYHSHKTVGQMRYFGKEIGKECGIEDGKRDRKDRTYRKVPFKGIILMQAHKPQREYIKAFLEAYQEAYHYWYRYGMILRIMEKVKLAIKKYDPQTEFFEGWENGFNDKMNNSPFDYSVRSIGGSYWAGYCKGFNEV